MAFSRYAAGWFQVGWSHEISELGVLPIQCFGRDLVAYRAKSGKLTALDAHCRHMGAHLGYGGEVAGDDIVCPWHGWKWDCSGNNVDIPYGTRRVPAPSIRSWPIRELAGIILLWHHPEGNEPDWEPPPLDTETAGHHFDAGCTYQETVGFPPQYVVENIADIVHIKTVHRWTDVPEVLECRADGPRFITTFEGIVDGRDGRDGPRRLRMEQEAWGPGLILNRVGGTFAGVQLGAFTPIDDTTTMGRMSVWMPPRPGDTEADAARRGQRYVQVQAQEVFGPTSDRPIWDHLEYLDSPAFTREESQTIGQLRKWLKRFEPAEAQA